MCRSVCCTTCTRIFGGASDCRVGRVRESSFVGSTAQATGGPDRHRLEMLAIARTASKPLPARYSKRRKGTRLRKLRKQADINRRRKGLSDGPPVGRTPRPKMYDAAFAGSRSNKQQFRRRPFWRCLSGLARPRRSLATAKREHCCTGRRSSNQSCSSTAVQFKACQADDESQLCVAKITPIGRS